MNGETAAARQQHRRERHDAHRRRHLHGDAWSFTGGANYNNQNGTVDDIIDKANATVVVTAYNVTYDANPHTATSTVTGVDGDTAAAGSSINVSGTTHTAAGNL